MTKNGVNEFIEIGPGKVLSGLIKRTNDKVMTKSINSLEDIKKIIMLDLKNKKVLITGASGGIGGALVKKFLSLNASVLGTGTNSEKLDSLKKNSKILK